MASDLSQIYNPALRMFICVYCLPELTSASAILTAVASRRRYSNILADFPWQWDGIITIPQDFADFENKVPEYKVIKPYILVFFQFVNIHQHFIKSLLQFEKHLFSLATSKPASELLALLGVKFQYQSLPELSSAPLVLSSHKEALTPSEFQNISSVVVAYSLVELLALRANLVTRMASPRSHVMYLPPSKGKVQERLMVSTHFHLFFSLNLICSRASMKSQMASRFCTIFGNS